MKLPVPLPGYEHAMMLWGKRIGVSLAYGALVGWCHACGKTPGPTVSRSESAWLW